MPVPSDDAASQLATRILAPPASDIGVGSAPSIALCGCAWNTPSRAFARTTKVGLTAGVLSCLGRLADRQPWVPTCTPPASHLQRNRRSRLVAPMKKLLARTNTAGVRLTSSRPSSWNPGPPRGSDQRAFSRPPYRTPTRIICFKEERGFVTCSSLDDVNRTPSHAHTTLAQGASARDTIHVSCACVSDLSSTFHFPDLSFSMWVGSEQNPLCASANEESDPLVNNAPLSGYEPKFFDDYHISETTEIFIQDSSSDTRPSSLHDSEISDDTIGRALSSPLFTQEREEPASHGQACHSPEESLLSSQSLSVCHSRTERPVHQLSSLSSYSKEKPSRDSENERIRILLEPQKEKFLSHFRAEIKKTRVPSRL